MMRRALLTLAAVAVTSIAAFAAGGGLPKGNLTKAQDPQGPCGYPALKKLAEELQLTHDQEQAALRIYNEYQKKEHEAEQEASKESGKKGAAGAGKSLKGDMTGEIKAVLTEDQRKKLDEILTEPKKKKKT